MIPGAFSPRGRPHTLRIDQRLEQVRTQGNVIAG